MSKCHIVGNLSQLICDFVFGLFQAEDLNPGKWKENLLYVGKVSVCSLTLCMLANLAYFLLSPDFFQNQYFKKILQE